MRGVGQNPNVTMWPHIVCSDAFSTIVTTFPISNSEHAVSSRITDVENEADLESRYALRKGKGGWRPF